MSRRRWKDLDRAPLPASKEAAEGVPPPARAPSPAPSLEAADEAWRAGQLLLPGDPAAAALRFEEAGRLLPPSPARAEQLAACYIGQAVAHLAAGSFDAAQLSFSRRREEALPPAAAEFARGLYELAQELRRAGGEERREAVEPLVDLVLGIRLPHPFGFLGQPLTPD